MTQAYNLSQLANYVDTAGLLDASAGLDNAVPIANGGTGSTTAENAKIALEVITDATGSVIVPTGTDLERDSPALAGYFRFNTDTGQFEGYNGTSWGSIGGGATGGGGDEVFVENSVTVTTTYTLTTNKNAMSVGPISINSGVIVTIPTGQRWVIL
jgi:hypothetical protein